jgi:hypothetical protein
MAHAVSICYSLQCSLLGNGINAVASLASVFSSLPAGDCLTTLDFQLQLRGFSGKLPLAFASTFILGSESWPYFTLLRLWKLWNPWLHWVASLTECPSLAQWLLVPSLIVPMTSDCSGSLQIVLLTKWLQSQGQSFVAINDQSPSLTLCQAPSGAQDQTFVTVRRLLVCCCEARSLRRELISRLQMLLTLTIAVILWPEFAGLMATFYSLRFETPRTWRARSPYVYTPGIGWPSYTPRH